MDNRDQIQEIKDKLDIVTVVQQYVPSLKRSGHNHFGLCPFHKEKTPSFSVNSEMGLFKCFGCGEGGDVIKFIEKVEGLDFPKALELAAQKAGVTLKKSFSKFDKNKQLEKERILEANHLTAEFFHFILFKHELGEVGRKYASKRKLTKKYLKKFLIGYAPKGYDNLKRFLIKKGFSEQELLKWGLLAEKNGKTYDKFRERLMFTIFDHQGDIVGFSGRLVDPEGLGPKYLNSPETIVYKKSKIVYGLYQAKEAIRHANYVVLVEGNIDILTSHQAGVENIVAPLGTALTLEQLGLIKRYTNTVYFALDTDTAGQKALMRALPMIEQQQMQALVLELGKFQDVDALIVNGGDWQEVLANPSEIVPYFMKSLKPKYDFSKGLQKNEYTRAILNIISQVNDKLLQSDYLKKLEAVVAIDMKLLAQEMSKIIKTNQEKGYNINVISNNSQTNTQEIANLMTTANITELSDMFGGKIQKVDFLLRYFLAVIAAHKNFQAEIKNFIKPEQLPSSLYQNLFKGIWDTKFAKELSKVEQDIFAEINLMQVPEFSDWVDLSKEMYQLQKRIQEEQIKSELEHLKLIQDKNISDEEKLKTLKALTNKLAKLRSSL